MRRLSALVAIALAAAGLLVNLRRPLAARLPEVPTDLDRFAPAVLEVVGAYTSPRFAAAAVSMVIGVAVPALLVATASGRRLVRRVAGRRARSPLRAAAVAATVVALTVLVLLPVDVAVGYVHEGRFGFRQSGLLLWGRDWLVAGGLTVALAGAAGAALMAAVARWPDGWPWGLVPATTALAAVLVLVWPVVVGPLFLPTSPLPDGPVRDRLEAVLARAGAGDAELLVGRASLRTTRVNALVTGLGPTRRVILYDTLLRLPPDQVAAVTAHELAHREHADIARGVLLTATGALPTLLILRRLLRSRAVHGRLGVRGPADPRLIAVAVAVVAGAQAVGQPAAMLASRRAEAAADHRALELTGDPAALIALQRTFTVRDLAHPDPPGWVVALWGTHPPVGARIRAAAAFAGQHELPLPPRSALRAAERPRRHPRVAAP